MQNLSNNLKIIFSAFALAATFSACPSFSQGINLGNPGPINLPPQNPSIDKNNVDVTSGKLHYEWVDLKIGANGIGALSLITYFGNNGGGFRTNFDNEFIYDWQLNLPEQSKNVSVILGSSSDSFFDSIGQEPAPSKLPNGSSYQQISSSPANYIYTKIDGTYASFSHHSQFRYYYNGGYYAKSLADFVQFRNGVRWTYHYKDISYTEYGATSNFHRVQSITSNTGYQIKFYYSRDAYPTNGAQLVEWYVATRAVGINNAYDYCNPTADSCTTPLAWPEVKYDYGANASPGYNLSITNSAGEKRDFGNNGIRDAGYSSLNRAYNWQQVNIPCVQYFPGIGVGVVSCPDMKVSSATINGETTTYSYGDSVVTSVGANGAVDTYGLWRNYEYADATSIDPMGINFGPVKDYTDPLGRKSQYEYQSGPLGAYGALTKTTQPEGNIVQHTRNSDGVITQTLAKAKAGSGLSDLTESRTVNSFGQPTSITDPRGNVTTITYDPTHGGVLTETGPAVGGIAPVKRYAYVQKFAWTKNAAGSFAQAALPVWLVAEERTCSATATVGNACAGGSADEVVVTYDYGPSSGPNNLQVRGKVVTANGVSLRICYGYDRFGNKISETSPRAGLTSCP